MRRIVYSSAAAVLTALILIGLISLIATQSGAAQQPSGPPPPRPTNMSIGFPMPSRKLCNDVHREGAKLSLDLASRLFCYVPLHNIWYGIVLCVLLHMASH
jgi:hypothetical protein